MADIQDKLELGNVDLVARTVAVPGRRKGAGTAGRIAPLIPDAVKAFRAMMETDWQTYSEAITRFVLAEVEVAALFRESTTPEVNGCSSRKRMHLLYDAGSASLTRRTSSSA